MFQAVYFEFKVLSENHYRSVNNRFAAQGADKKQKKAFSEALSRLKQFPLYLSDGRPNEFKIKLVRVANSALDYGNFVGGVKAGQDTIAEWIGLDDASTKLKFEYLQQRCPRGFFGVLIEIEDLSELYEHEIVLGDCPRREGQAERDPSWAPKRNGGQFKRAKKTAKSPKEPALFCWVVLPWMQRAGEGTCATRIFSGLKDGEVPPQTIWIDDPNGLKIQFTRTRRNFGSPLGEVWLFQRS